MTKPTERQQRNERTMERNEKLILDRHLAACEDCEEYEDCEPDADEYEDARDDR